MNKPLGQITFAFFLLILAGAAILAAAESSAPGFQTESRALTIQEAVRMTLARAPEVIIAEAQSIRASEAVRESRALNRPQLVIGTGLAYNNGYPLSIEGAAPSIFQVSVSQAIFSKRNNNLIHAAEENGKAGKLGAEAARNTLASRTALVYFELFQANKVAALAVNRLETARKQQEIIEVQLGAGKVRPVEATLARTATSSAQQQLLEVKEQMRMAEAELQALTGLPANTSIETVEPKIESPLLDEDTLYKRALEITPEILQAEATLRSKEFHVEAEKGEGRPQLDLVSQYALFSKANNYDEYFNRFTRNNYLLGLSVQVPLFNGSRTSARVAQSRQEVTEARCRLESMKSGLKLSIQKEMSALRVAKGASDLAKNEIAATKETIQISEALLDAGRISPKDLEDVRSQLYQKELSQLEAEQTLFQRRLALLRITGMIASAF
jgi:outer membrane protein